MLIGLGIFFVGNIFFNEVSGDLGNGYIDFLIGDILVYRIFFYLEGEWFCVIINFDFISGVGSLIFYMYINGGILFVEVGYLFVSWDGIVWDYFDI